MNKLSTVLFFLFTLLLFAPANAQTGSISGIVKDSNEESLIGATVSIEGTGLGTATGIDGDYLIKGIKPGVYTIKVEYLGYENKHILVVIKADETTQLNVELSADPEQMAEVVVTGVRVTNSERAVVQEIKESEEVVSGVSAEQISKSQDRTTADVMKRIPGVTVVDNRFVMVRGLGERYNTVLLNDMIAPSTEIDRRSFSFDVLPSGLLDRLLIYKSGAADLPGDFAGAVIKVYTRNNVDSMITQIGFSLSGRSGTTFHTLQLEKGRITDYIGIDSQRGLPSDFPKDNLRNYYSNQLFDVSRSLKNTWSTRSVFALPDMRFNATLSRRFFVKGIKVSGISSLNFTNTFTSFKISRASYDAFDESTQTTPQRTQVEDEQYARNSNVSLISNWTFEYNSRNRFLFRNVYTRLGTSQTTLRSGIDLMNKYDLKNLAIWYLSRGIYMGQLQGEHLMINDKTKFNWTLGYSSINRNEPDYRRVRTQRSTGSNETFQIQLPSSASTFDAARFYSSMNENLVMASGDVMHNFKVADTVKPFTVKAGYYVEYKKRVFEARWLSYKWADFENPSLPENQYLTALPVDHLFNPGNIAPDKLVIEEGTNLTDAYQASSFLSAGYVGTSFAFLSKFNLSTGLRLENYHQVLTTPSFNPNDKVNSATTNILPFANLSYAINEKMLIRGAYSRTVNRGNFRELAPFSYYDFEYNVNYVGNPGLKMATIHNYDLRWELYPSPSENIALGIFYKSFINPIELYNEQGASLPVFIYGNAPASNSVGAELEIRKSLSFISASEFWEKLTVVSNVAVIKSRVELGNTDSRETSRAMQGQSPYVVNAGIYYNSPENRLQVTLLYNVIGKRIFLVGNNTTPTIYEMSRNVVDCSVTKGITNRFLVRLGIQDVFNQQYRFMYDSNLDSKITSVDGYFQKFRRGQYITAGLSYSF
jgi:outer membrane receptor for ferrienterochelin and colicin